jgi:LPS export ABC transporter protein LptC
MRSFSITLFKGLVLVFVLLLFHFAWAQDDKKDEQSDQQISEFSLSGYGEKGKKNWDISGKSADIFTEVVKLDQVVGNLYGKEEDVKLTAQKGDFNKTDGKVHLEKDVVITTSKGTKLTTDSLDWDRKQQKVSTRDLVNIQRENMTILAAGATGEPNLKKVELSKDVKVNILPTEKNKADDFAISGKITITSEGPLVIDYEKNVATFNNNVKVERSDSVIYSDRMEIYFLSSGASNASKIDKIVAKGNVKVVRGENVSYSEEAVYSASDKKLTLSGRPKLIIYSTEGLGASSGN